MADASASPNYPAAAFFVALLVLIVRIYKFDQDDRAANNRDMAALAKLGQDLDVAKINAVWEQIGSKRRAMHQYRQMMQYHDEWDQRIAHRDRYGMLVWLLMWLWEHLCWFVYGIFCFLRGVFRRENGPLLPTHEVRPSDSNDQRHREAPTSSDDKNLPLSEPTVPGSVHYDYSLRRPPADRSNKAPRKAPKKARRLSAQAVPEADAGDGVSSAIDPS